LSPEVLEKDVITAVVDGKRQTSHASAQTQKPLPPPTESEKLLMSDPALAMAKTFWKRVRAGEVTVLSQEEGKRFIDETLSEIKALKEQNAKLLDKPQP
jgi:hypothetical protein